MKQPRLLKKVYEQVLEHENYDTLPKYIKESLDSHFNRKQYRTNTAMLVSIVDQINDFEDSPTEKKYMNKMLRNTWNHLYLGEDNLSQYEITVSETNPYNRFIKPVY